MSYRIERDNGLIIEAIKCLQNNVCVCNDPAL